MTFKVLQVSAEAVVEAEVLNETERDPHPYFSDKEILSWGQDVILEESLAVKVAGQRLGPSFSKAVNMVLSCSGTVVVCALGKSGHVGSKIAASLMSTGTPATFLHACEALHGDLGIFRKEDILIAITNSGETDEVLTVSKFARKRGIKVIAITGNPESSLAGLADALLDASIDKEADSLNLAPTSSTTVTIAIGDALTVALMKARDFKRDDFGIRHAGGSLGRALVDVEEFMRKIAVVPVVRPDTCFDSIIEALFSPNLGVVPVTNYDGFMEGYITEDDIRHALSQHGGKTLEMNARDLMNKSPQMITLGIKAIEVARLMRNKGVTAVFVTDHEDNLLGLVRQQDLTAAKITG